MSRYRSRSVFAHSQSAGVGRRLMRLLMLTLLLVAVGGVVFLGFWDIQPPSSTVEKVIPHERFTR